jgi:beta-galactosidase
MWAPPSCSPGTELLLVGARLPEATVKTTITTIARRRSWITPLLTVIGCCLALMANGETITLNDNWRFLRGDVAGAEQPGFDDTQWRQVLVPHDWSIEDLPGQTHPFSKDSISKESQGYMLGAVGWYRRTLSLPDDVAVKTVLLDFEAVYMDAQVWVNGQLVTRHPYGYTQFILDVSQQVHAGNNVVAVRVDNPELSSRWYSGSGIIRPAHLHIVDKVHVDPWGSTITTPDISASRAKVRAVTPVINANDASVDARLISRVVNARGVEVARQEAKTPLAAAASRDIEQELDVAKPLLWSTETPNLYTLIQEVRIDGRVLDSRSTRFGIRSLSFDAKRGFLLNGKHVLLRGGNIHHDNYMLGAAGIARADVRKVEMLKAAGYNAIRSAHNPASKALLDAADELGMLVIDEAFDMWSVKKNKNDYARFFKDNWSRDLRSLVAAGRNHPSVILWSIGNEIPNMTLPAGASEAQQLAETVRALDPSRPATSSAHIFGFNGTDEFINKLDVAGYNYNPDRYLEDHEKFPNRIMYGSESFSAQAFDYWYPTYSMPWVIGDFVWASIDYLGEAGLGWSTDSPYPWHLSMSGEIDATGLLRPAAYYRQVLWRTGLNPVCAFIESPQVEGSLPNRLARGQFKRWEQPDLIDSWQALGGVGDFFDRKVVVYSENDEVELFVNGLSKGRKPVNLASEYKTEFWVRYKAGEMKVVGYNRGKPVSQWVYQTPGKPAAIRLSVDRSKINADGDDLGYITAELIDAKGVRVTREKEDKLLTFKVNGAAILAGVGNGNPVALESFQSGQRSTYHGRAVAVIRASKNTGTSTVEVSTPDLPTASTSIEVSRLSH